VKNLVAATFVKVAMVLSPSLADAESLVEAVRSAINTNPALDVATFETRASAYELLELKSEYQPRVSMFADLGAQRVDDPSSLSIEDNDETKFRREVGLNVDYMVFDGYRRANQVYSNAARLDANLYRLLDASETLSLNATEVYIDVVRHLRLKQAAEANLERHRQLAKRVRQQVDAGRLPVSDLLAAEDRVSASELVIIEVRRAGRNAEIRYKRIIGHERKGPVSISLAKKIPRSYEALLKAARENSYRIRVAGIEIERAEYERGIVNADIYPQVSLNAGVRKGWDVDGVSGTEDDVFLGFRMDWELSRGGRLERDRALIERKHKAFYERRVAMLEVEELAAQTWNSYISNTERARSLAGQLAANKSLLLQFDQEFEAGKRTLLDLLEGQRQTFDVEFLKVSAEAGLAFSTYRLLAAQSRLAQYFGVKPKGLALTPNFESRAKVAPRSVFQTTIPALD